jgi:trigger factor
VQLTVEKLGATQARVSFSVASSDFQERFRAQLQELAGKANLKGFRPGKVPTGVIEKMHGEQVRLETKKHFLERAFQQAVEEQKLRPAAWPRVTPETMGFAADGAFAHTFDVLLRPDVELKTYYGYECDSRAVEALPADVDAALVDLRRQQSRLEPAGDEGLPVDGMAVGSVELVHAGTVVLKRDGLRLALATPPPGIDVAEFQRVMKGCKEGETREVAMTFPDPFEKAELVGQSGTCRVAVKQAYRIVPPTDDEIYKVVQVDSAAALHEKAREHIVIAKQTQEHQRIENALFERLLAEHPLEIPEALVEEQAQARLAALQQQLTQQGMPVAEAATRAQQEQGNARVVARRAIQAMYLIEAIAQKESLQLSQEDFSREIQNIALRNRATFEQVRDHYNQNQGLREQLALELLERKVRTLLREKAVLKPAAA